jgi:hypothetical protein
LIKHAAKTKAVVRATLTKQFAQVSVQKACYSIKLKCPYNIMNDYVLNGRNVVTVTSLFLSASNQWWDVGSLSKYLNLVGRIETEWIEMGIHYYSLGRAPACILVSL